MEYLEALLTFFPSLKCVKVSENMNFCYKKVEKTVQYPNSSERNHTSGKAL